MKRFQKRTNARQTTGANLPKAEDLRVDTFLPRKQVVRLLENRINGGRNSTKHGRDAVNQKLAYAERQGHVISVQTARDKTYQVGKLLRWAAAAWDKIDLAGFPIEPAITQFSGETGGMTLASTAMVLPNDVEDLQKRLLAADAEIRTLREAIDALEREAVTLRVKAQKWDEKIVAKNTESANAAKRNSG